MLYSVEEKWIKGLIERDTYTRWYDAYTNNIITLKGTIERLDTNGDKVMTIFNRNLFKLTGVKYIYTSCETLDKREFVKVVFDSNLYYENGIYRTPTMVGLLSHNSLKMKEKGYLIYEKKGMIV